MERVQAVISDFGGVLTSPLVDGFTAFEADSGVPLADLGAAMAALTAARGINPLFALETGRLTEAQFLSDLADALEAQLGRPVDVSSFGEIYFAGLTPNQRLIDHMAQLRGRGYRMAICTNNVREWSARWQAMLPVSEIFEVVVDSSFVGARKPDPEIYAITLERLGVAAQEALFIDDLEVNCEAARAAGMAAVWFRDTDQAIADIEAALAGTAG